MGRTIGCGLVGLALACGAASAADKRDNLHVFRKQHDQLRETFAGQLQAVAETADRAGDATAAAEIRATRPPTDAHLLRADPLPELAIAPLGDDLPEAEKAWQTALRAARVQYAKDLYVLSRRLLDAGHISYAYDVVREVAWADSDHAQARGILGFVRQEDRWLTPFAADKLRKKYEWSETFGWLPAGHAERYEAGERFFKGKWIPTAQEAAQRESFEQGWTVESEHYLVKTNTSLEEGVELSRQLEDFHAIFYDTFAGFFNTRQQLQQLFTGTGRRAATKRFEVHYFRSRDEYNERLRKKIPVSIEITTGLYIPDDKKVYFFHSDDPETEEFVRTTLFHEATHQLFSETRDTRQVKSTPGRVGHFWIVEGIACYMESFQRTEAGVSLGDPGYSREYSRFLGARAKIVNDDYYVPLARFADAGQAEFQADPQIRSNYSQAAGLAHFFLHYEGGVYREALIDHLSDIYSLIPRVRENPRPLSTLTGVSYAELDRQYQAYISTLGRMPAAD